MGFFSKIFIQEENTGNIIDITNLDKDKYETFLNAMQKLQSVYLAEKLKRLEVSKEENQKQ